MACVGGGEKMEKEASGSGIISPAQFIYGAANTSTQTTTTSTQVSVLDNRLGVSKGRRNGGLNRLVPGARYMENA